MDKRKQKGELNENQLRLVQMVFNYFKSKGEWPNARYLQVEFRSNGDSYSVLKEIGFPLIRSLPDKNDHAGVVKLSLSAINQCTNAENTILLFLGALKVCVNRYLENPIRAIVAYDDIRNELGLNQLGTTTACQLLLVADQVVGGASLQPGWEGSTFTVDPNVLRYEKVEKIDDFLTISSTFKKTKKRQRDASSFLHIPDMEEVVSFNTLHDSIVRKCGKLFADGHYSEASLTGFKVVKDCLRQLTGHEKSTDAFGKNKGNLHIPGAAAQNVEDSFNEGVQFLAMAIDKFRNEKSHTAEGAITDPIHAYEYLRLSSLVMHFLDRAKPKKILKKTKT